MVPKVNSGANVYGVLQYNRIKVEAGEGRILYMQGIPERSDGRFSIEECAEAFGYYTALNPRVRKPVVHFSLNPSPEDRLSEAQLTQLAAEFMERMGYGRQPYVVFLHEDIARRHMHVVSVRVDEQGRKIDHNNELRRAMAVCRKLEHEYGLHVPEDGGVQTEPEELRRVDYRRSDLKHQLRNVVMTLKQQYGFQSLAEFNTLLERYGVAAEEVRGDVRGRPYRGLVYHVLDDDGQRTGAAVKASRLGDFFGWKALEEKFDASKQRLRQHPERLDRTRREIDRARSGGRNRKEFTAELRENGIDAVFRENDAGRIYGVTFIDRTTHQVFNGSRLGKEYAADAFEAWFNGREQESSTPMPEELRPLPPLEPPQPGQSSVEEFEEYIETHYVSMPDVMGELMEYTPEKEWETASEYRLFPRRKKRRRKIRKEFNNLDTLRSCKKKTICAAWPKSRISCGRSAFCFSPFTSTGSVTSGLRRRDERFPSQTASCKISSGRLPCSHRRSAPNSSARYFSHCRAWETVA